MAWLNSSLRSRLLNGSLVAASLILALIFGELTLRHTKLIPETDQSNADQVYDHSRPQYHKLKPNLKEIVFTGVKITSNQYGFRDQTMTRPRRPGVQRIAVMGDSWAFGWGVTYEKTFVRRLEKLLQEQHPQRPLELLNFAIPGHNMNQHFAMLGDEVLSFRPDRVVLFLHLNDIDTILPVKRDVTPQLRLSELKISQFFYSKLLLPLAMHWGISNPRHVEDLLSQYSPDGPYLSSYLRYVDGYLDLVRHRNIELTVFLLPLALARNNPYQLQPVNARVKEIFAQRGIEVFDLLESYTRHTKDELIIHTNDYHPNEFASALLAQEILRRLEDRKWLDGDSPKRDLRAVSVRP